jgi:hypothetical protein
MATINSLQILMRKGNSISLIKKFGGVTFILVGALAAHL